MKGKQDIFIYIIPDLNENGSLERFEWIRLRERGGGIEKKIIKCNYRSLDIFLISYYVLEIIDEGNRNRIDF